MTKVHGNSLSGMKRHNCELRTRSNTHLPLLLPDSSKIKKVGRVLRKGLIASEHHPEAYKYLKSNGARARENQRQVLNKCVIHPLSLFKKYWDVLLFVILLSHFMITPLTIALFYDLKKSTCDALLIVDLMLCGVLLVAVGLGFITGTINKKTHGIILDLKHISKTYAMSHFIPDLICCIPFISLAEVIVNNQIVELKNSIFAFMILLYTFSLYRVRTLLEHLSGIPRMLNMNEKSTVITKLCIQTIYIWHWTACFRFMIPSIIDEDQLALVYDTDNHPVDDKLKHLLLHYHTFKTLRRSAHCKHRNIS